MCCKFTVEVLVGISRELVNIFNCGGVSKHYLVLRPTQTIILKQTLPFKKIILLKTPLSKSVDEKLAEYFVKTLTLQLFLD